MKEVKLTATKVLRDAEGNEYVKAKASDALKSNTAVKGQTGDGDKAKFAFYEPVSKGEPATA